MRNYLSFGGGVNSVALYLLLMEQGLEPGNAETGFEAVYVWMPDWPETHEYLMMMEYKGYPVTVIMPNVRKQYFSLIDYCSDKKIIPFRQKRWCTSDFKIKTLQKYFIKPCFVLLGIDYGEHHRAVISSHKNTENRYPLIEHEIDRIQCIDIIKKHGLTIPIKSGCWICPFQRVSDIKRLRRIHSELFCKAIELENQSGKLLINNKNLIQIINEADQFLFEEMAYPPCECGL